MHYLVHYGEIALKGKNRKFFEKKLQEEINRITKDLGLLSNELIFSRVLLEFSDKTDRLSIETALQKVFGIETISPVTIVENDIGAITNFIISELEKRKFESFRVSARRASKGFPMNSQEINERVGAAIVEKLQKKVDLEKFDINCFIEIVNQYVFVYFDKIRGRGGLPVGSSSPVLCLLSGGIDSPVAANMMQKRGARVTYIYFDSYPATAIENQDNVKELVEVLTIYQGNSRLFIVPFLDIQKEIVENAPDTYRVLFYRRMMMRIAQKFAEQEGIRGLVTGENLGQVASQTVENIHATSDATSLPILRPLIGYNKDEIVGAAQTIGTYEISIRPHDDCCSLYIPNSPATKANMGIISGTEEKWDFYPLLDEAIQKTQIIEIK